VGEQGEHQYEDARRQGLERVLGQVDEGDEYVMLDARGELERGLSVLECESLRQECVWRRRVGQFERGEGRRNRAGHGLHADTESIAGFGVELGFVERFEQNRRNGVSDARGR